MAKLSDPEIREILEGAVDPKPGSWLVGLTLVLRDSEEVEGTVKVFENDEVVLESGAGLRRVRIEEIENVVMHLESPGPE